MEFTPLRRGIPWAAIKTALRSCWPWHFWKRLQMAHPIHVRRIAAYLLLCVVPLMLLYAGAQATVAAIVLKRQNDAIAAQAQTLPAQLAMWQSLTPSQLRQFGLFRRAGYVVQLASMRLIDEQYAEQARQDVIDRVRMNIQNPPQLDFSYSQAMLEAITRPAAGESSGTMTYPHPYNVDANGNPVMMTVAYPVSPERLWETYLNPNPAMGWSARRGLYSDTASAAVTTLIWSLMLLAPLPLSLALLPVTRKRAKVRWAHIGRVFLYSFSIPIAVVTVIVAAWLVRTFSDPTTPVDDELWTTIAIFGMPVATIAWWWAAFRNYLRMPHALAVTLVMSVFCVLSMTALIFVIGEAFFA